MDRIERLKREIAEFRAHAAECRGSLAREHEEEARELEMWVDELESEREMHAAVGSRGQGVHIQKS